MKITYKTLLIILVAIIIVSAGISGSVIVGQKNILPATMAKEIQDSVDSLINEINPGMIMHIHHEIFNRHGSADAKIMELDFSVPEETVGDIWLGPVDNTGAFIGFKSQIKDIDGNLTQETNAFGDDKIHRDIRTGKEVKSPWKAMPVTDFINFTGNIPSKLLEEGWSLSSRGQWDGEETVIFEKTMGEKPRPDDGSTFINVPYTMDLNPVMNLLRVEIRLDNPLLIMNQRWVVDAQGEKTLVSQDRWTQIELSY